MRFAIISDIHSNLHALEAVLADAQAHATTHTVCLGDIVGYNAYPSECVERIRGLDCPVVKGNHDEQVCMRSGQEEFNPMAETALEFSRQSLTDEQKAWLGGLRLHRQVRDFTIVHATLDTPHKWGYVFNQLDAAACFNYQHTNVCFIGHTHSPRAYIRDGTVHAHHLEILKIEPGKKYLINVGSVGQPRDLNWRAAYCIYDCKTHEVELRRVEYDVASAQAANRQVGLPDRLAERLAQGK